MVITAGPGGQRRRLGGSRVPHVPPLGRVPGAPGPSLLGTGDSTTIGRFFVHGQAASSSVAGCPYPAFGTWDPTTSTPPSTPHPNCATCRSRRSHHREISSSTAPVPEGQHENSPGQPRAKPGLPWETSHKESCRPVGPARMASGPLTNQLPHSRGVGLVRREDRTLVI
jgi:hypothetical protein